MTDVENILGRYTAAWNEADPARRHKLVAGVYAADAYYANQASEYRGVGEIEGAITLNYQELLSKGFTFEAAWRGLAGQARKAGTWLSAR